MGRNSQPVSILVAKGKKHLTKKEIQDRQEVEIKLGDNKLICPDYVKRDVVAYKKWKEIVKIYKDFDSVTSGDSGILGRYCKTFSEYHNLINYREKITQVELDTEESAQAFDALEEKYGTKRAGKMFEKIEFIMSAAGVISFDKAINSKMDMLVKMEDRIFLNPLAKVKNVPKKEPKKVDPLANKGFGNV